jgi:cell division protease FtsH
MSESLGPQTYGENQELMFLGREINRTQDYSEDTARKIDAEVNKLLRDCFDRAKKILTTNKAKLEIIADLLLERETLDGRDVEEIVEHGRILSEEEREKADREKQEKDKARKDKQGTDGGDNGAERASGEADKALPAGKQAADDEPPTAS